MKRSMMKRSTQHDAGPNPTGYSVSLPDWAVDEWSQVGEAGGDADAQMRMVVRWSRLNVERGTGGPFAAGVFTVNDGRLIAMGVNRVVQENNATAHAEVVAISLAQKAVGSWDLNAAIGRDGCRLVVNAQPCTMCFGALIWSGVRELMFAVDKETVQQITSFDEGPLPANWAQELASRGIRLLPPACRDEAVKVLEAYVGAGQPIYNASRPGQ